MTARRCRSHVGRSKLLAALLCLLIWHPAGRAAEDESPAKDKDMFLTFEVRSMPWARVLEWLSDRTGKPVISTIKPPSGKLNIISPKKKYTLPQVMDLINEFLMEEKLLL